MSVNVFRRMLEKLSSQVKESRLGNPFFAQSQYNPHPLNPDNFNPIERVESDRRIAFLDGGNQEIVGAPNFSIQINRIYFCIFDGKKRVSPENIPNKIEYFSATYSDFRDGQIFYDTIIIPLDDRYSGYIPNEGDLSFNSMDRAVMQGNMRAGISRVASIARRFGEWEFSRHVIDKELQAGDIFVADGTLQAAFPNESQYVNRVFEAAKKSGAIATGLSKSCTLFTDTGLSLVGAIRLLAEKEQISYPAWIYHPIVDIFEPTHRASLYIAKLNSVADRIYRYEIYQDQAKSLSDDDFNEIFSKLAENSKDISIPGYPYGLVVADREGRVRFNEMEGYRTMLLSELSQTGNLEKFKRYIQAIDTHDALDMLAG
ncbi:MAG: DNA double-strand break repair nuclease NurA [Candidatus Thorarchaeota archaeon]|nr:DNA double-strand break repair nuclease NurA [Candidatus Thorarchaeota archaeon]